MKILLLTAFIIIMAISAGAQIDLQPAAFYVDYAAFATDNPDESRLEIYYQVYTSKLSHILKDGRYYASYNVSAVMLKKKKQVDAKERDGFHYFNSFTETRDKKTLIIDSFKFNIKPGKYKLRITLNDLNGGSAVPLETVIEIPKFKNKKPQLSNIKFIRELIPIDDSSASEKGNFEIVPSCSRRYGDNNNQLKFYFEYYDPSPTDTLVRLIYELYSAKKFGSTHIDTVYKKIQQFSGYIDSINLENLSPGSYELTINASVGKKGKKVKTSGKFSLIWSALELVKNDYKTAVNQLYYIAGVQEMEHLKQTPEDQRIGEWNKFWKSKDPSPDTEENEVKVEYYKRLAYANREYGIPGKSGWKTDMGMVYIINGEPDEIERHPFDLDTKPYEIWYYYSPRRRFLFIDVRGYGEYILQYPYDGDATKRIDTDGSRSW